MATYARGRMVPQLESQNGGLGVTVTQKDIDDLKRLIEGVQKAARSEYKSWVARTVIFVTALDAIVKHGDMVSSAMAQAALETVKDLTRKENAIDRANQSNGSNQGRGNGASGEPRTEKADR